MPSFAEALRKHGLFAEETLRNAFEKATELVQESVVDGSELTGAPGQPVGNYQGGGKLRASFQPKFLEKWRWQLTTDTLYAEWIENGASPIATYNPERGFPRSERGGYHSLGLTVAGFDRIIDVAVEHARKQHQNQDGILVQPFTVSATVQDG